jgi:WXXGXW repeat (2 copies)
MSFDFHHRSFSMLLVMAAFAVAGCHNSQQQATTTDTSAATTQDQGADPAAANLAPATYTTTQAPAASQQAAPSGQDYDETDESANVEPPAVTAPQPPPALPDYDQPPAPGDGYIWTPGYWNYASTGYYWVPGVWVRAPYEGALWTPGYWGHTGGHYAFYPGHWGTHIGFYGGINYGFGYTGTGYEGGYWNAGHFTYNRVYNNVNATVVRNVYNYNVVNRTVNTTHVSFNGGSGGVHARPAPPELAARQEPVAPRMNTQIQHEQMARADHTQFVAVNHGRPANPVVTHPVEADRNVKPAPRPPLPARPQHPMPEQNRRP